ncbi:MAG: 1-deoxy-D-xylulose-5-phosphate synthase [Holosporales bacterium]|jgi:1-deoxy-D-xylulose-5-phosphate synthase|nr:1-deoxy-D-xylulose-5-phosphate synthase [Holosporales bacterium]
MILDSINCPSDLKLLSLPELIELCSELRSEVIRITSKNGGHLGSNLGSVELLVAAHFVFDCPIDRFIFDVGHQAYSHKLLTGRREIMENLRRMNGASGFPDPAESEFDHFIAGHASTSLSAAIGIARARDLKGLDFKVVSILGDGSMSGGMIYEAMNNIYGLKNFVVILNDNQMSISESVGCMRSYLSKLMRSRKWLTIRKYFRNFLNSIPIKLAKFIELIVRKSLSLVRGSTIFDEFGFHYIGPVDGHNLSDLIEVFQNVRDIANYKPVIIHAVTQKGKGCAEAENDETKLHGVDRSSYLRYTDVFGQKIVELGKKDERIVCITAAMKHGCGLEEFSKVFPNRFFDVGIAEEHAVTFAAGIAREGLKPFVCIYSTFLQRAFDQIFHDVILQNLPVRIVIDKAGLPGGDGKTHAGLYDISLLQNFENITITSPSSKKELERILEIMAGEIKGPMAVRFPKSQAIEHERPPIIPGSSDTLVLTTGDVGNTIYLEMMRSELERPTIWNVTYIKPFDFELFYELASKHQKIIVYEEGVFGGLSQEILEKLFSSGNSKKICDKLVFKTIAKVPIKQSPRPDQVRQYLK